MVGRRRSGPRPAPFTCSGVGTPADWSSDNVQAKPGLFSPHPQRFEGLDSQSGEGFPPQVVSRHNGISGRGWSPAQYSLRWTDESKVDERREPPAGGGVQFPSSAFRLDNSLQAVLEQSGRSSALRAGAERHPGSNPGDGVLSDNRTARNGWVD